jgi:2,3-bisphosphoglycerate-dependent phosphoglycerate mutase
MEVAMEKQIFIIRHCAAEGQPPSAQLTGKGFEQAHHLARFFDEIKIDRIISSPFLRARQSVEPLAQKKGLTVEVDERLSERTLSTEVLTDWLEELKTTYDDLEYRLPGGESSSEAMKRAVAVIDDIEPDKNTLIVSHGNLISLLLKYYDSKFGFEQWKKLSNPDVFLLKISVNETSFERLWED